MNLPLPFAERSDMPTSLAARLPAGLLRETRIDPPPAVTAAYRRRAGVLLASLKGIREPDELRSCMIPLIGGPGWLVPLCELHAEDGELIATLARWRQANMSVHPTQFTVTLEGTATWIRSKLLDLEGRILFLVLGAGGELVGHYGFIDAVNDDCEVFLSNALRGVPGLYPGIIGRAQRTMIGWATETLGARRILGVVFADNRRPIRNLRRDGFRELRVLPLRRRVDGERVEYRYRADDDPAPPDRYHVLMEYIPETGAIDSRRGTRSPDVD